MSEIKFDGDKLFKFRKEKGLSQEKLALAIGVSRQTIYLWESNQSLPDVEKVGKICKILEINLSDIVDGVDIPKELTNSFDNNGKKETIKEENKDGKFNYEIRKNLNKIILILVIIIIIIYLIFSTIKFIRLSRIISKWNELDESDSYYMSVREFLKSKNDNNFDSILYEKYYQNGILTTVWTNEKSNNVEFITIYDYNNKYIYLINDQEKTYVKEKMSENDVKNGMTYDFRNNLYFGNNNFLNFIFCLNPNMTITYNDAYELKLNNKVRQIIDSKTGFVRTEESLDSKLSKIERHYQVELNTDKTFEINLDEYTEVTQ